MVTRSACLACERGVPKLGRRRCPECGYVFRGTGWDGIDAHWRARHEDVDSYERFWKSLCRRHRASKSVGCPACLKGMPFTGQRQCPECAQVFRGKGWAGLDAHWRSQHLDALSYADLVASLCPGHKGDPQDPAGFLPLGW